MKNNEWRARTTGWMPCTWKKVTVVVDSGAGNAMPRNMFLEMVVEELNGPREARASKAQEVSKSCQNEIRGFLFAMALGSCRRVGPASSKLSLTL